MLVGVLLRVLLRVLLFWSAINLLYLKIALQRVLKVAKWSANFIAIITLAIRLSLISGLLRLLLVCSRKECNDCYRSVTVAIEVQRLLSKCYSQYSAAIDYRVLVRRLVKM